MVEKRLSELTEAQLAVSDVTNNNNQEDYRK